LVVVLATLGWEALRLRDPDERRRYGAVIAQMRWWMVPTVLALLGAVLCVYLGLARVSLFRLSWWCAIGGAGNPVLGRAPGAPWWATGAFALCFACLVPRLAYLEEEVFRSGSEEHGTVRVLGTSVLFGLMHAVVGVPLGAALALSIAGVAYHGAYRVGFTRFHAGGWEGDRSSPWDASPEESGLELAQSRRILAAGLADRHWVDSARERATAKAAALHATFNWTVLFVLTVGVIVEHAGGVW
jgi:hypothetical protein